MYIKALVISHKRASRIKHKIAFYDISKRVKPEKKFGEVKEWVHRKVAGMSR